jgi:O-antigen ligase
MNATPRKHAGESPFADGPDGSSIRVAPADSLRPWLLAAATALWVARSLFPSESAALYGDGLPVVMLWLALAVVWLLGAVARRQFCSRFGWTDAAVLLLIGLHTLAALWAATHQSPRPAVNMLWEWTGLGLGFFLTRQLVVGDREARALTAAMIALAVGLSGYGLYQRKVEMPRAVAQYKADPERTLHEAGIWAAVGSPEAQLFESRLKNTEPIATFALTNSLAATLAPWLVIAVGIAVSARRQGWLSTLRIAACVVPVAACLLLTKSRSSYVATLVGLTLLWLFASQRTWRLGWKLPLGAALATALLLAALLTVGKYQHPLLAKAAQSLGYRIQYWQSTMHMIADYPLAGCGPGNFQDVYTAYKLPEASEEVSDPHNFLMEVWATAGTPAMLAMLVVLGSFAWSVSGPLSGHRPKVGRERVGVRAAYERNAVSCGGRPPSPHPRPLSQWERGDHAPFIIAGGLSGFLLALPLGQIGAAPPGLAAMLIGLPLAAVSMALCWGWVRNGNLPPLLPAIGLAVLLVNLLAAGGIGQPAVAGAFWLLLALGLHGDEAKTLPRIAALAMLVVAIALSLACFQSGYSPVLRCQTHLRSAERELMLGHAAEAEEELAAAAVADPLAAAPWRHLAALTFQQWRQHPNEQSLGRFQQCTSTAEQLAPRSASTWMGAGDRYLAIFKQTHRPDDGRQSLAAYGRAVECYPHSALCHAKLALAHRAAGDRESFRREADAAFRLEQLTPHSDKKLPPDVRKEILAAGP